MTDFAQRRTMMVDTQVRPNEVTSYPVIEAMLNVPREQFVPESRRDVAYVGNNIDLAPGRVLLEPRTLGKMMDILNLQNGDLVLDVGCGYGYSAAVMARIAEAVVAVEEDAAMAAERKAGWPRRTCSTSPSSRARWPRAAPARPPMTPS